ELAPHGIHVVVIEPGAIDTEWGAIAGENLVARSGSGAYAEQARQMAGFFGADADGVASKPSVVADAVARAVTARRPRPRYAVGRGAKVSTYAVRVLPTRAMDAVMRTTLKTLSRVAQRRAAAAPRRATQRA
ncbi:MAG TPA: short-chain dehydrogenase/reductase, partial [Rugosimonospora sp.]|nr:short-chain dehydrogenase/reductase [Rugosimonospora sp.]